MRKESGGIWRFGMDKREAIFTIGSVGHLIKRSDSLCEDWRHRVILGLDSSQSTLMNENLFFFITKTQAWVVGRCLRNLTFNYFMLSVDDAVHQRNARILPLPFTAFETPLKMQTQNRIIRTPWSRIYKNPLLSLNILFRPSAFPLAPLLWPLILPPHSLPFPPLSILSPFHPSSSLSSLNPFSFSSLRSRSARLAANWLLASSAWSSSML